MKNKKQKKISRQYLVLFSSFAWFATVLDMNKDIEPNPRLLRLYLNLAKICVVTDEKRFLIMDEINKVIAKLPTTDVDYMLLSLCLLSEYYDQLRGKKKVYQIMSHKHILELQDECLEDMPKEIWEPTMNFATAYVKELLKEN